MSDPDGDSQMRSGSSSSDEAESEAMFPSENEPLGTAPQTTGNALSVSEPFTLSPPHSQDPGEAMDTGAGNEISDPANEKGPIGQVGGWVPQSDFAKSAAGESHKPGAGWDNKKAIDEYQRAMTQIEDRNFSLKEFGDPFDVTEQSQGNGNGKARATAS